MNDVWEYLTESALWSLGGLAIGYILGRTEREVREVLKKEDEYHGHQDDQ